MKSTGRIARGGIIEITAMTGDRVALTIGMLPMATPRTSAVSVDTARAENRRRRLAQVSFQNSHSPVLGSSVMA